MTSIPIMNEDHYSVSELNNFIRDVIQSGFPQAVWVSGEIQGYNRQKGKNHIFFQLVEKDEEGHAQKATIDLVIWAGNKGHIEKTLNSAQESFEIGDDIEVKFLCRVDFYPPHGRVRLSAEDIDPFFTLGKLAQEKEKLIAKLREAGVLDKNRQVELNSVPLALGLITSDNSAAYNDFISELSKSSLGFKVYLRNSLMQGKRAEKDVCKAIDELGKIKELDAIVITRGGGSISDLSCFDSEAIAKKIAESPLPVLSGIGHEINITITDLSAHTHAKTPTAIAQFLVERIERYLERLDEMKDAICEGSQSIIEREKEQLKSSAFQLQNRTSEYLKEHNMTLVRLLEKLKAKPIELMNRQITQITQYRYSLAKSIKYRIQNESQKIMAFKKFIGGVHPVNTLKRGFSITRTEKGNILRNVNDVKEQTKIITELAHGKLLSEVKTRIRSR